MAAPAAPTLPDEGFSTLFEFLPIGAYRSLPGGRHVRVNPALVRLNGFATEAEQLREVRDIAIEWYVDPARRSRFMALLERDGRVTGFESEVRRYKTGERFWVSENAHLVRDAAGRSLYYEGTVEAITERVAERKALARSREELRQIVDLVPGFVYRVLVLPEGRRQCTFCSAGVRELFEVEPEEVMNDGMLMHRLRHPEDRARIEAATRAALQDRQPLQLEYRVLLASGRVKWVHLFSASAPSDESAEVRVGMAFDITARKMAELALQENGDLWKRALESSGDGVWDVNLRDGTETYSPKCRALYGYTLEEMPDRPGVLDERTHPDDLASMRADRAAHVEGGTPSYVNEHRVRCKDGQWKWILSRGLVISRDAQGKPLRMIGTHTDITAEKEAQALRLERDRAATADLAKSQFLSRVSHELRTPMHAILGFAQLLELEPGVTDKHLEWVRLLLASGQHLLALMEDILDLSSAQTGQLPMASEPVALGPLLQEVLTMLAAAAEKRQVVLHNAVAPDEGLRARGDRKRLMQVLSNLVSNAIKYNRRDGWVRLTVQREAQHWVLHVADSGQGLSAEQQARLFNPFERLGAERGPVAGTGLGLALSQQLVQSMGGSITVRSQPGEGAVFSVRLPAA